MPIVDYLLHGVSAVTGIFQTPATSVIALATQVGSSVRQIRAEAEIKKQLSTLETLVRNHTTLLESSLAHDPSTKEKEAYLTHLLEELKQQFPALAFMDHESLAILQGVRARNPESVRKLLELQGKYDIALLPELFGNDFERISQQQGVTSADANTPLDRSKLNIVREESGLYRVYHVPPELIVPNSSSRPVLTDMLGLPLGDSSVVIARDPEGILEISSDRYFRDPLLSQVSHLSPATKEALRKMALSQELVEKHIFYQDLVSLEPDYKELFAASDISEPEKYVSRIRQAKSRILSLQHLQDHTDSPLDLSAEIRSKRLELLLFGFDRQGVDDFVGADNYTLIRMYEPTLTPLLDEMKANPTLRESVVKIMSIGRRLFDISMARHQTLHDEGYVQGSNHEFYGPISLFFYRIFSLIKKPPFVAQSILNSRKARSTYTKIGKDLEKQHKEAEDNLTSTNIPKDMLLQYAISLSVKFDSSQL